MHNEIEKRNIDSNAISSIFSIGKNEVTLEFHQHDDAQICLMEMRFYIPATSDNTTEDPVKVWNLFFNTIKR